MPNQTTTIRCVLCGHGIEVALAIGQMLKCSSCGTTFMAPDTADAAHEDDSLPSQENSAVPAQSPAHQLPAPTPLPSPSAATLSTPKLKIDGYSSSATAPPPKTDVISEQQADDGDKTASDKTASDNGDDDRGDDDRQSATPIALSARLIISVVATAALLGGGLMAWKLNRQPKPKSAGTAAEATDTPTNTNQRSNRQQPLKPPFPVRYSSALARAQRLGGIRVQVTRIRYAPVVAKTNTNKVLRTKGASFLQIELEIQNRTTLPVQYQTWYGSTFTWKNWELTATLIDDQDRRWPLVVFDDAKAIRGHTRQAQLDPGDRIRDLLVFEPPTDDWPADVQSWELFLPALALQIEGGFGFIVNSEDVAGLPGAQTP